MQIRWQLSPFHELNANELYQLLRLRSEVFVVEQNCVFLDMDNYDQQCWHLLGWEGHLLAAAVRLVPPGLIYDEISIGRVMTSPLARGTGKGKLLMEEAIRSALELFGNNDIRIGAQ
ncbi:MAG TPA: GNAT family N-acetyltransferase, partial [Flavihumibacter sp.]|nr:GNAT family N-acetyltransferase [Flavihumibacter sp.]